MAQTRKGDQISVRVPAFAKQTADQLPGKIVAATGEKKPSQPELVAALVSQVKAQAASQALKAYRKELARKGLADFHR
jgi:hypothetical protein